MTPEQVLRHADTGELWPSLPEPEFSDMPSAYAAALEVRFE
jgi:hypothetical protein